MNPEEEKEKFKQSMSSNPELTLTYFRHFSLSRYPMTKSVKVVAKKFATNRVQRNTADPRQEFKGKRFGPARVNRTTVALLGNHDEAPG